MDYSVYPAAADVEALLKSQAFWPVGGDSDPQVLLARLQAEIGAEAAVARWERETGYFPFLQTDDDEVTEAPFVVDPGAFMRKGALDINGALLSLTSVTGQVANGTAYTFGANEVFTKPSDAARRNKPFTWLDFPLTRRGGFYMGWLQSLGPLTITVRGVWGYCTVLPANVFQAILQEAGLYAICAVVNDAPVASIQQDGFSKAFNASVTVNQQDILEHWDNSFRAAVGLYRRIPT